MLVLLAALVAFSVLGSQFSVVDPATYVGNVYGHVDAANALISVGDRVARTDEHGAFLINAIPAPYDGRDYEITIDGASIGTFRVLPGAAMALELNVKNGTAEWHYRHESTENREPRTANYTKSIFATREGLVGGTTANGHVIVPNDHFAALPSRRALSTNFGNEREVRVTYRGRTVVVPVWDIGPWNIHDDYWNPSIIRETFNDLPRGKPEAQAAFFEGYNGGLDERGRVVRTPAGIDLADGTFLTDLGLTANDFVEVEYLWLDTEGPVISSVMIEPNPTTNKTDVGIDATVTDASPIETAEVFIDVIGTDGSGIAAIAIDGAFDSSIERIHASVGTSDWVPNTTHVIYVHAHDVYGNWGPYSSATVDVILPLPKRRAVRRS